MFRHFPGGNSTPHDSFEFLKLAVKSNNADLVRRTLAAFPHLLNETSKNAKTVLHIAAKHATPEVVKAITCKVVTEGHDLSEYAAQLSNNGWSALHYACLFSNDDVILHILDSLSEEKRYELAQHCPNTRNCIPATLLSIDNCNLSGAAIERILDYSKIASSKKLSAPVDINSAISALPAAQHNLAESIRAGCEAVNATRKIIVLSSSHLDTNSLNPAKLKSLYEFTRDMRDTSGKTLAFIKNHYSNQDKWLALSGYVKRISKFSIGNCIEYAHVTAHHLLNNDVPNTEIVIFSNNDHAFVVIGRDRNGDIEDYRTWGEKAVVVDAWAGTVFAASQIPEKLYCFYRAGDIYSTKYPPIVNINGKFNPTLHSFAIKLSFDIGFAASTCTFYKVFPFLASVPTSKILHDLISTTTANISMVISHSVGLSFTSFNSMTEQLSNIKDGMSETNTRLSKGRITPEIAMDQFTKQFVAFHKLSARYNGAFIKSVYASTVQTLTALAQPTSSSTPIAALQ